MNPAGRLDEGTGHVLEFTLATSRQQCKNRLLRRQAKQRPGIVAPIRERQHVSQRMADVAHRNAVPLV